MGNTSAGKDFEEQWQKSYLNTPYEFVKLIDGVKWGSADTSKFTPKNICDYIQHTPPYMWLLELKSVAGASVSFHPNEPWVTPKGSNTNYVIKPSQVEKLMKRFQNRCHNYLIPGFVINFRERVLKTKTVPNQCYFIHIQDFLDYAISSGASSIGEDICKKIGITIKWEKKIKNYRYNIPDFVRDAVTVYLKKGYIVF